MEHFVNGLAHVLDILLNLIQLVVIASVIISWVNADPYNPIVRMISAITEPIYRPIRKYTSRISSSIDLSPIVVVLIVVFLQKSLIPYLIELSRELADGGMGNMNGSGVGGLTGDHTADQLNRDVY